MIEIHCSDDTPLPQLPRFFIEELIGTHRFEGGIKGINTDTGGVTLIVTRELIEQGCICGWSLAELFAEAARLQFPNAKDIKVWGTVPPSRRSAQFTV
jgi:hypothetical protein